MKQPEGTLEEISKSSKLNRRKFIRDGFNGLLGGAIACSFIDGLFGQTIPATNIVKANSKLYVKKSDKDVEDILTILEHVPDRIQQIVNSYTTIKITDGRFTDIPEYIGKKELEPSLFRRIFIESYDGWHILDKEKLSRDFNKRREFFANKFADYYFSEKSRAELRRSHPLAYNYLKNFEKDVHSGVYHPLEKR